MSARLKPPAAVVSALAFASCAVGPTYVRPEAPKSKGYTVGESFGATPMAAGQSQQIAASNVLTPDWWRLLRAPELDAIVADALAHNPTLDAAEATLRKTQDTLRAGYGVFFPDADLSGGASRQKFSPARFGSAAAPSVFNLFTLSGTVSYAFDVWGGQRRTVEALRAQVDAQRYTMIGAYEMIAGNIVNAVIAAAAYQAQIDATNELLRLEEDQVHLGHAQAEAGTVPYSNVLSLESQIALTRATLPPLAQKIEQAQHLIATLAGRLPGDWCPPAIPLAALALPTEIPVSLPAALVRQRPDVLVAEAQLHASTAQIGVATAAMLPNVTLSASYGLNSTTAGGFGSSNSMFWSVLGGLTQPLFHGGALYYQRKAAIDARDQAFSSYRQTVLGAFQQIADGLRALQYDGDALAAEEAAVKSAGDAFRLVQINYDSGLVSYLEVLTANAQYLQSRLGFIQVQAQRLEDTVALFVALGGGWWNAGGGAAGGK
ncbi:MAG TPA: efflux transporter outer membrane subunit [Polyangia bacterium]|nr:efflux transporter outer membrane subunit [Polyangia bacterium]